MEAIGKLRLTYRLKVLLLLMLLMLSASGWRNVLQSLNSEKVYKKDFLSGYLIAKALQTEANPYLPIPELARRWTPAGNFTTLDHPTPHTLLLGWICYPFAWFDYVTAAWLWLAFSFICLLVAIRLLLYGFAIPLSFSHGILVAGGALAWMPVEDDLVYGQFNFVLLILWLGSWLALRSKQDFQGGALLGFMMTLKLVGWPILLWLAWQRRWRSVLSAGCVTAFLHGLMIALYGWPILRDYYFKHGPLVSAFYRNQTGNLSLWTFADRILALCGVNWATLLPANALVLTKLLGVAVPLLVLALALRAAHQSHTFDAGFALLLSVSLLLNPVAWTHYFVVLCLPFLLVLQRLHQQEWPRTWTIALCLVAGPLCVPHDYWGLLGGFLTRQFGVSEHFFLLYWGTCHILAVLGLGWLLWRVDTNKDQTAATSHSVTYPMLPPAPVSS